jgi:hypothetical protein
MLQQFAFGVRGVGEGQNVNDFDIEHFRAKRGQGRNQFLGRRAAGADEHTHAAAQLSERFFRWRPAR